MKLIVISSQEDIPDEHEIVNELLVRGLNYFHLRKPGYTYSEMERYIREIETCHRDKIIVHSHHELCATYNLKGVHYNAKWPFGGDHTTMKGYQKSCSMHSINEVEETGALYDYVFLSPVFNSISKAGYQSGFDLDELRSKLPGLKQGSAPEIIGLGGIDEHTIDKAKQTGFDGVAVLGALWNRDASNDQLKSEVISRYLKMSNKI